MKLTHLIGFLICIVWTVCTEAQIYFLDVISVPSNSRQVSVRQQRQQVPTQRLSFQQQPQQRTVQNQSQKTITRSVRQPQAQGATIAQQVVSQQSTSQRRQQNKADRRPQQQSQEQRNNQRQQQSQTQTQKSKTQRPQQSQKQQNRRQQQSQKRQQQAQQQQNHRQQQSNGKQQSQTFKQQSNREQQSQTQRHQTQQQQRPHTQDIVVTFPSSIQQSQQQREQWSQQQSVAVTFPGITRRPSSSSSSNQNSMFTKPNNPFLTAATSQSKPQNHHFSSSSNVGVSSQVTPFATSTTDSLNNGFSNNFDSGSLIQSNGFSNTASTNFGNSVPFNGNGFTTNGIATSSSSTNSFGGTVDIQNNPFSSSFGSGTPVQNNGFGVASSTNVGSVANFGGNNFNNGASINNQNVGGVNGVNGFNTGVSSNAFSTATTTNIDNSQFNNGFNEFDRVPVINNGNTFNNNGGGFRDRGENFDYNRWFSPHRPQANHYRDFAGIFNSIDQKAESDYNTSTEDDEMNDDFNGRSVVSPGQYPHMAALGYRSATGGTKFKCGGSLISELYVLTAAHCCFLNGQAPHLVRVGDVNLKKFEHNDIPQRRGIARVIKHPYYNDSLYYNDIGLLELANPIVYTYYVRPIRLWATDDIPYNKVFTMGYGSTDFAQAPTDVLTELDLSIVPLDRCNRTMPSDPNAPYGISDSQICAKDFEKNRDTCQGDSGGPLQLNLERPRSRRLRYYLVGIISYGTFCRSRYPGIYTRVSSYIDWIASEVWPEYFNNFQ